MSLPAAAEIARHQDAHAHLFGRDYRWHHNGQRWTLRPETDEQRDERLTTTLRKLNERH